MFRKLSLQWRFTIFISFLLAVCCIGLSLVLNMSAYRMADSIDAFAIQPAQTVDGQNDTSYYPLVPATPHTDLHQAKHSYLRESVMYTALAVLAGGILTYFVVGKALAPIRLLNEQIKNISAHNLDGVLEVPQTKDELSELTLSFNAMLEKLSQAFTIQKRFSADAAHELRTPLAILQTKLDVFQKSKTHTTQESNELLLGFQKQLFRLRKIVDELLELANSEHELQIEEIDLYYFFDEICNELSLNAESKKITLSTKCEGSVKGDYTLLYRAFYNLIDNAIKYNVENGKVDIESIQEKEQVIILIKDTGKGIPALQKEKIFEPFYRIDESRSTGGAGLGLPLVQASIQQHHGRIEVMDNEWGGSCFKVSLPK